MIPIGAIVTGLTALLGRFDHSNPAPKEPKAPHINFKKLDWKNQKHLFANTPVFPQFRDSSSPGLKPWQPDPSTPTNFGAQSDFYSHYGQGPEWDYFTGKPAARQQELGIPNAYPVTNIATPSQGSAPPPPPPDPSVPNRIDNSHNVPFAGGGLVSLVAPKAYAKGGGVKANKHEDAAIVQMTIAALMGKAPNAEVVVQEFIKRFGEQALSDLMARVQKATAPGDGGSPMSSPDMPPGRPVEGPGDGLSDSIPAAIDGQEPAALSDGEFVVPADVVSGIGNGSSNAGVKQLHGLINHVRKHRTGTTKQPPPLSG